MPDHDDTESLGSYVGRIVHDRIAAPYLARISELEQDVAEWEDNYARACDSINRHRDVEIEYEDEITSLKRSLHDVAAERDEMHVKWAEAERIIESNAQYEDEREGREPVTKSAIEVPKPETDAGEGRVIAFLEMTELQPGMRFRLDNGKPFETVIHIERGVTSESIFNYDPDATVKITVAWGGSGHFRPDRVVQVDTGPHND